MKNFFKKFLHDKNIPEGKVSNKMGYLIVIALIGLLLLIISNFFSPSSQQTNNERPINKELQDESTEETAAKEYPPEQMVDALESSYEKTLEDMLNKIKGVSEADVMINLDSSTIQVFEKDLIKGQQTTNEADTNGGTRKVEDHTEETQVVLVRQGDQEVPLLVQTKKPDVRGVFVVAQGVDHATVKMWVIEAVAKVLDVPTHKISVLPKK